MSAILFVNLLSNYNSDASCRGLKAKHEAELIVKSVFREENIPFVDWNVVEIPYASDYEVSIIIQHTKTKQTINLRIDDYLELVEVTDIAYCLTDIIKS